VLASNLVLRNNELHTVRVIRVGDRVLENDNRPDDVVLDEDLVLLGLVLLVHEVARVPNHRLGPDRLPARGHPGKLSALVVDDLVDLLVEHVGPAVDSREAGEALGQLAEAVERVDVRRFAVPRHRRRVQHNTFVRLTCRAGQVAAR